jgi:hypothetical protein
MRMSGVLEIKPDIFTDFEQRAVWLRSTAKIQQPSGQHRRTPGYAFQ